MISGFRRTKLPETIFCQKWKLTLVEQFEVEKNLEKWKMGKSINKKWRLSTKTWIFFLASFDQKWRKNAENGLKTEKKWKLTSKSSKMWNVFSYLSEKTRYPRRKSIFSEFGDSFWGVLRGYCGGVLGHLGQVKCSFGCFWVENQIWHVLQWFCGALDLVEITISRYPRRKSIFPSLGDTFWGNMLKRREMGLQVTKNVIWPLKMTKTWFFGQNGPKWGQNGSKWLCLFWLCIFPTSIFSFVLFSIGTCWNVEKWD